jgi:hypothetical protein
VAVTDLGGGSRPPWLLHNQALLRTATLVKTEDKTRHFRFTVALLPGSNRLEVRSANADGSRESEPSVATLRFDGKLPEPELHVLTVGINRYAAGAEVKDLDLSVADVKSIAAALRKHAGKLYRAVHVTELCDEQATRAKILAAVADVAKKAQPQDTLFIYVASHGHTIPGFQRYYLIPHDFKKEADNRDDDVRKYGLAIDELGDALAEVPALKRVLIFDTCRAGSAVALSSKSNPLAFRRAIDGFNRAQGVYSLSATGADELAGEPPALGHGILAYTLLAALGEVTGPPGALKAGPGRGKADLDVLDWFRYARDNVPRVAEKFRCSQQVRMSGEDQPGFPLLTLSGE